MSGLCYGKTVAGKHCELPDGHYPATHHRISLGSSWMAWTDESMAEFARIADEMKQEQSARDRKEVGRKKMSTEYEAARRAVLARSRDPHMTDCEHCKPYVEELAKAEMENRSDLALNTLGKWVGKR